METEREHTAESDAGLTEHDWKPTTNTHAVYKCRRCGQVAFHPHPLPRTGCVTPPESTEDGA